MWSRAVLSIPLDTLDSFVVVLFFKNFLNSFFLNMIATLFLFIYRALYGMKVDK